MSTKRTFQPNGAARLLLGAVAALLLVACAPSRATQAQNHDGDDQAMTIQQKDDRVRVLHKDELVTQYIFKGWQRPVMYPLVGPDRVRMNREYPFDKESEGESHDHPHHQSLWFGHGDVNGTRFWKTQGTVQQQELISAQADENKAVIKTHNHWLAPEDGHILSDTRTVTVRVHADGSRTIDYKVKLMADQGDVTFGDTKEGTMGIRMNAKLRLDREHGGNATAMNSQGARTNPANKDNPIWGQRAKWINYGGTIDGKHVGVMIFDHPDNPRHPTWWHARAYGLAAANPFGISYFEDKPRGTGDMKLPEGETLTFHYRFVFYSGQGNAKQTNARYQQWVQQHD